MRCDRCHRDQGDVEILAAGAGRIQTLDGENRLRNYLRLYNEEEIGGMPKLCAQCLREIDLHRILTSKEYDY
jgi:hypothetical protein